MTQPASRPAPARRLITRGRSFIAETVFSHPSKLELLTEAQAAGYIVAVHAVLIPEDLAVQRVAYRVRAGGHSVPEDKIRERHRRLWSLVAAALARGDISTVYDNSRAGRSADRRSARRRRGYRLAVMAVLGCGAANRALAVILY